MSIWKLNPPSLKKIRLQVIWKSNGFPSNKPHTQMKPLLIEYFK